MRSLTLEPLLLVSTESVEFCGSSSVALFTLTSNCEYPVAFQVLPSDDSRYRAQPDQGVLQPATSVAIHIDALVKTSELDTTADLLRVFCTWVETPSDAAAPAFWTSIAPAEIQSHSLGVVVSEHKPYIPMSSNSTVAKMVCKLPAIGDTWINGLANEYDARFPPDLAPFMSEEDFTSAMKLVNEALIDHWPCVPCMSVGYGCCICTGGLSLYCAWGQIKEAEDAAVRQLGRLNRRPCFASRNISWSLRRVWYRHASWIEITMQAV
ncbi:hypothetical protein SPRG_09856 [Saprolegnia parasitica CBS 223.65]|uniref:MSP domain-containing protein n=1 Tax=Saprolegnia parasitica (strain CBS 223.65) TaxID=695850 RepID=A0A067CBQ6_SAPPC|nr:hypothetical protein SPRG_09856 [Saprolegnia parasitica CBS 223.65]KDO24222.1 hypothetical protein SPRG_09856 [Saprolegnia parasitica CBS 223.65]|eukprot:XP_012204999.1 hypothetical protein SPRG_09856 [Saprolegnia parasitica CBS 223.65]